MEYAEMLTVEEQIKIVDVAQRLDPLIGKKPSRRDPADREKAEEEMSQTMADKNAWKKNSRPSNLDT